MRRIHLSNSAFEGDNSVYLFDGDGPTTVVDTGVATEDTLAQLVEKLGVYGVYLSDIEKVLVSHWHEDHAGLAGEIQAESGAVVLAHPDDLPLIEQSEAAMEQIHECRTDLFEEWKMPEGDRMGLLNFLDASEHLSGRPPSVDPVESGTTITAGDETLEVLHLPGHTKGLCGFVRPEASGAELLGSDALLPEYTPNVGGADVRVENSLATYLSTLSRIADRNFEVAHPGHRYPISDPADRARDIVSHHRARTERVLDALDIHGRADVWTVSDHLFGELSDIHILHGPGEVYSHFEHLLAHGVIVEEGGTYTMVEENPDMDRLFPGVRNER